MNNRLHIVCLDAPSPPDYGGAIDMYYKIKALAKAGKKISLHYFNYNSQRHTQGLDEYCEEIYSYDRKSLFQSLPLFTPHIINSRTNQELIERLNRDHDPVLLEGLHCSGVIPYLHEKKRIIIRMHNEESAYYHHLSKGKKNGLKKLYFSQESRLVKRFQNKLSKNIPLAVLSSTDAAFFTGNGFTTVHFIPCFIPWQQVHIARGRGPYCLYHGNMLVSENEEAAAWLIQNVYSQINHPLVIAGKGISKSLQQKGLKHRHISFVDNPSIKQVDELVQNAHINVLPSMNSTGVKLKLLNALLNGRHCITNDAGIKGSLISSGVVVKNLAEEWRIEIERLMSEEFTPSAIDSRREILSLYNNRLNAEKLNALW